MCSWLVDRIYTIRCMKKCVDRRDGRNMNLFVVRLWSKTRNFTKSVSQIRDSVNHCRLVPAVSRGSLAQLADH